MRNHPTTSIVICTRNRAASLQEMLSRLPIEEIRSYDCEIILVDNGSTDDTAERIEGFIATSGLNARRVLASKPGLSNARNVGIAAATGEIICFLDDDCYLHGDYFQTVFTEFADKETAFIGGQIWLHDPQAAQVAVDYETRRIVYGPGSYVKPGAFQGASLVFRRAVLKAIGPFDPTLGAGAAYRCEDIEICGRATARGYRGIHVPELVVYHDHGRKPGPEVVDIERMNDEAFGAYHAILVKSGRVDYFAHLLWHILRHPKPARSMRYLKGFCSYMFV